MRSENPPARDVDEYISRFDPSVQEKLLAIRRAVRAAAPHARETISYDIPAYLQDGPVLYFAAFQKHLSVYPAPRGNERFREELARYRGGKGTIQIPLDEPLPLDLITRIVEFRLADNAAIKAAKGKRAKS